MIVPFAAGGPTDTVARLIAEPMTAALGQQVIVENVGGAGGTLGAGRVAKAEPDGYTLLLHHIGQATSASLYRKLPYKPGEAFEAIGLVTDVPMTVVARGDFAAGEHRRADRVHQDQQGPGDPGQCRHRLGFAPVRHAADGCARHAHDHRSLQGHRPGDDRPDGRAGRPDVRPDHQHHEPDQGRQDQGLRGHHQDAGAVAAGSADLDSAGVAGFEVAVWHGLYAPKGTPQDVLDKLAAALQTALADPKVIERFADLGTEPVVADRATPAALSAQLQAEIGKWQPIIEAAGVYAD